MNCVIVNEFKIHNKKIVNFDASETKYFTEALAA